MDGDKKQSTNIFSCGDTVTGSKPTPRPVSNIPVEFPREKLKRIDYVLMYKIDPDDKKEEDNEPNYKEDMRQRFEQSMLEKGFELQQDAIDNKVFIKIHTPLFLLCTEAEKMNLEMPLIGCELYDDGDPGCWSKFKEKHFVTDDEIDFVSGPFRTDMLSIYVDNDDPDKFFRPSLRSFLTYHILNNMDVRKKEELKLNETWTGDVSKKYDNYQHRRGLLYLLLKKVYNDGLILHDETIKDPKEEEDLEMYRNSLGSQFLVDDAALKVAPTLVLPDTRKELNDTWTKLFKYQPLWKIRNYYGEKIALYFAWSGTLASSLWIPAIFGTAIFFYGLYLSILENRKPSDELFANSTGFVDDIKFIVESSISTIKQAFDNDVTPYFGLCICLWGTIFLEIWKRKNAKLSYEWDTDTFEDTEPDRPQFIGTHQKQDPIIPDEITWIYPVWRQLIKYVTSLSILIIMVICVFICAASVILYRVFMTLDFCTSGVGAIECLIVTTVCSSLLQAIAIMILGKIYDKLAWKLTDWENHRTQTQYNDALIIKMFAFQFANSYTSLFYIAFFRGENTFPNGLFNLGPEYQDTCGDDGNCMAMLSLQVLILMVMKPMPKFLKDIIIPLLKKIFRKIKMKIKSKKIKAKGLEGSHPPVKDYLEREQLKPDLGDFTLAEFTEKCLVYGFLMLFSVSMPLAPLIALIVILIDIRVDSKRMLWWYRRPVSYIAQDIGMWYAILQFLNISGVVTNAFLIAFTSSWGSKYDTVGKLWIVIGFEHIVFGVKFILAAIIPDVPNEVRLAQKREKYQVGKILSKGKSAQNLLARGPSSIRRRGHTSISFGSVPDKAEYYDEQPKQEKKKRKKKKKLTDYGLESDSTHQPTESSESTGFNKQQPQLYPKLEPLDGPHSGYDTNRSSHA